MNAEHPSKQQHVVDRHVYRSAVIGDHREPANTVDVAASKDRHGLAFQRCEHTLLRATQGDMRHSRYRATGLRTFLASSREGLLAYSLLTLFVR
jgi:hypothetical protein